MSSDSTKAEKDRCDSKCRGVGLYYFLLAVQTFGAGIMVVYGVPIHRQLMLDFSHFRPEQGPLWWAGAAVLLIQAAYWTRVRLRPPLPQPGSMIIGHLLAFIARISFILVTSTFAIIFMSRFPEVRNMDVPLGRALLILLLFFSMFCWTLELERLAKALQGEKHETS